MVEQIPIKSFDSHILDGHLHHAAPVPAPGVVMIPEIYGITQSLSKRLHALPARDIRYSSWISFSRLKRGVVLAYDEAGHKQGRAYHDAFEYAQGVKDMQAAISVLRARPECNGRVGVVGFCLGGTMAYLAAAQTDADAAAGYYGTRIHNFLDDAKRIQRPLVLHFGERDHTTSTGGVGANSIGNNRQFLCPTVRISERRSCVCKSCEAKPLQRRSDCPGRSKDVFIVSHLALVVAAKDQRNCVNAMLLACLGERVHLVDNGSRQAGAFAHNFIDSFAGGGRYFNVSVLRGSDIFGIGNHTLEGLAKRGEPFGGTPGVVRIGGRFPPCLRPPEEKGCPLSQS